MIKKSNPPVRSVLITFNDDLTHAVKLTNYHSDSRALGARAKCHDGDTYSEYEGARIALARLYGVDPSPEKKPDPLAKYKTEKCYKPLPVGADLGWGVNQSKFEFKGFRLGDIVKVDHPVISNGKYHAGDIGVVVGFGENTLAVTFSAILRNRCVYPEELRHVWDTRKDLFAALTEDYGIKPNVANAVINLLQEVNKHD